MKRFSRLPHGRMTRRALAFFDMGRRSRAEWRMRQWQRYMKPLDRTTFPRLAGA